MYELNDNIRTLIPYEPITGEYQIRLDANESFLTPPVWMREKIGEAVSRLPFNRYPDPYAVELCRTFGYLYGVRASLVTAGNGSDELIALLVGAFLKTGEEIVTLDQDFSMYRFYSSVYGSKPTVFPKRDDLTIDTEALCEYILQKKARMLVFSNPCNPTSLCLDRKKVLKLVESVPDCLVVVDEAYMDFADDSVLEDVDKYQNLVVLKTCSKAIGLAAFRLGFMIAGEKITQALRAVKSPYNVNMLTQAAAQIILQDGDYLVECIDKIIRMRDSLYRSLSFFHVRHTLFEEVYPTATNFVYIRAQRAKEIYKRLLDRSIAVRCFDGYLRISAGTKEENEIVLFALGEIAKELETDYNRQEV